MSTITTKCNTVPGLIRFAKSIRQEVHADGETFWWAPVGAAEELLPELRRRGYHAILRNGRDGIGWSKRRAA